MEASFMPLFFWRARPCFGKLMCVRESGGSSQALLPELKPHGSYFSSLYRQSHL